MSTDAKQNLAANLGSLVRLGLGWLGGYLAGKGVAVDVAGLEPVILAAVPVLTAAWAWWHNRAASTGALSH